MLNHFACYGSARNGRLSRRHVLRAGVAAPLGLSTLGWLRASAAGALDHAAPAKTCVVIWLEGGPSHIDLFDPKPEAAAEIRGPFAAIDTAVPGMRLGEHLPLTAQQAGRLAVVRSVSSNLPEHNLASQFLLTGYRPSEVLTYPSQGAVLAHQARRNGGLRDLPPYVAVPDAVEPAGAGFLPAECAPFAVGGDPARPDFQVRDLPLFPGVTADRLARRKAFVEAFDRPTDANDRPTGANQVPGANSAGGTDRLFDEAYRLVTSAEAQAAFDLSGEPEQTRARYGLHTLGQSCLLARRLVAAGVPFVTVTDRGWDTHDRLVLRLAEGYTGGHAGLVPKLDQAFSALLADLSDQGLLDSTLVVLMGEFGRTPRINTLGGRDHWSRVFSVVLAGGGVPAGVVVGASDARGESPANNSASPADLVRTLYLRLGISAELELTTPDGRPIRPVPAGRDLFA